MNLAGQRHRPPFPLSGTVLDELVEHPVADVGLADGVTHGGAGFGSGADLVEGGSLADQTIAGEEGRANSGDVAEQAAGLVGLDHVGAEHGLRAALVVVRDGQHVVVEEAQGEWDIRGGGIGPGRGVGGDAGGGDEGEGRLGDAGLLLGRELLQGGDERLRGGLAHGEIVQGEQLQGAVVVPSGHVQCVALHNHQLPAHHVLGDTLLRQLVPQLRRRPRQRHGLVAPFQRVHQARVGAAARDTKEGNRRVYGRQRRHDGKWEI